METITELKERIKNLEEQQLIEYSPYVERNLIRLRKKLNTIQKGGGKMEKTENSVEKLKKELRTAEIINRVKEEEKKKGQAIIRK